MHSGCLEASGRFSDQRDSWMPQGGTQPPLLSLSGAQISQWTLPSALRFSFLCMHLLCVSHGFIGYPKYLQCRVKTRSWEAALKASWLFLVTMVTPSAQWPGSPPLCVGQLSRQGLCLLLICPAGSHCPGPSSPSSFLRGPGNCLLPFVPSCCHTQVNARPT